MTKQQEIKTFARLNGLTVKACRASGTTTINGKITWNGTKHIGWVQTFNNYGEMYDFLLSLAGARPWAA